jgi:hypothetical protein
VRITKARPILYLWIVFAANCLLVVGLFWFTCSIHLRASSLVNVQRETASKAEATRAHIEAETDISKLRHLAFDAHERAEANFSSEVNIFNAVDVFSRAIVVFPIVTAAFVGLAIYGLSRRAQSPNQIAGANRWPIRK